MKHLKKFENFYLNDDHLEDDVELDDQRYLDRIKKKKQEDDCDPDLEDCEEDGEFKDRNWGDDESGMGSSDPRTYPLREKKKISKEEDNSGLTAKQKKLPKALQDSILRRMKKKKK